VNSTDPSIGKYCTIAPDVKFGDRVVVHGFANLYGCQIDDDCRIGTFVEIQKDVVLGKRVRVQSHSFICSNVFIEDDVFIGHNVSFINDRYPTSKNAAFGNWKSECTRVRKGASIGTGSVILCGVEIGQGSVVGAGAVVTKNITANNIFAGVPAKLIRTLAPDELRFDGQSDNP
jgi:acetyltransferase-like isoleucine patch superfamily enzyme